MGWEDRHLHHFEMNHSLQRGKQYIGIPADENEAGIDIDAGYDYKVKPYLVINEQFTYIYDCGDNWIHAIEFEGFIEREADKKYPLCIAGKNACPPEDVGGITGNKQLLEILQDPTHEDFEQYNAWSGDDFDSNNFNPKTVVFDNPIVRYRMTFG